MARCEKSSAARSARTPFTAPTQTRTPPSRSRISSAASNSCNRSMKYCPQCNRQYHDGSTFCTDDGSLLREELSPPRDPNWDPRVRGPQTDAASEQPTQWLPRDPPAPGAWVPP